jgi:Na+/H+ antiporter NhaD/arsenite permease-like protein
MLLFGLGSFERSLKSIPWGTLLLVCGMSTYIELLSRVGLAEAVSALVQKNIAEGLLPAAFASSAALLSAFSSSVGVALPVFMPIVEAVSKTLETGLTQTLIIAVAVGSHLVDASPLSTLGALCLAQIRDSEEQNRAYRALLVYSFVMIPVAALWAFVIELLF